MKFEEVEIGKLFYDKDDNLLLKVNNDCGREKVFDDNGKDIHLWSNEVVFPSDYEVRDYVKKIIKKKLAETNFEEMAAPHHLLAMQIIDVLTCKECVIADKLSGIRLLCNEALKQTD